MRREQGPGSDYTWTHRLLGLLPHLPSRRSSALLDCCCSVIRVNRPLQLSPHEIGRLHETGRVWNAVSLSLLLLKNPNYQNLSAKTGQKDKADAVAYPLWMSLNNFRRRSGKKKKKTSCNLYWRKFWPWLWSFSLVSLRSCCHMIGKVTFKPVYQVHVSCFLLTDTREAWRFPFR